MTRIQANIGGAPNLKSPAVGRQAQVELRQGVAPAPTETIDFTDPQYATPRPAPKRHFGKYVAPVLPDVPQLAERNIRVRAVPPATYYTADGVPIPPEWVTLPLSPGLLAAIKAGDLERGEDPDDTHPAQHHEHAQPAPRPQRPPRPTHQPAPTPTSGAE